MRLHSLPGGGFCVSSGLSAVRSRPCARLSRYRRRQGAACRLTHSSTTLGGCNSYSTTVCDSMRTRSMLNLCVCRRFTVMAVRSVEGRSRVPSAHEVPAPCLLHAPNAGLHWSWALRVRHSRQWKSPPESARRSLLACATCGGGCVLAESKEAASVVITANQH